MNTLAAILIFLGLLSLTAGQSCAKIISRAEWGARAANEDIPALSTFPPSHVVIHHTVTGDCNTLVICSRIMKSMQNYHMETKEWPDIGYNFGVGGDGIVYEGRGWNKHGAHTIPYNSRSIGIAFIGTFTGSSPTYLALNATQQLIACGVEMGQIATDYKLIGHRQAAATECPGSNLFATIKKWPNWEANPTQPVASLV